MIVLEAWCIDICNKIARKTTFEGNFYIYIFCKPKKIFSYVVKEVNLNDYIVLSYIKTRMKHSYQQR